AKKATCGHLCGTPSRRCPRKVSTGRGTRSAPSAQHHLPDPSLLFVAARQIPHLVQPALFLLRCRFAGQPFPLLDQLADLLATLVADLRVELGPSRRAHALSSLLADLLVELVPALRLDRLAAFAADLLVERPA